MQVVLVQADDPVERIIQNAVDMTGARILRRQDAEARAKDLERERAAESRLKTCLGGAVLAAIREGRLDQAQIVAAISPGLREQDRAVLAPLL